MIRVISAFLSFMTVLMIVGLALAAQPLTGIVSQPAQNVTTQTVTSMPLPDNGVPQLKTVATISDDVIRAGDLWENAGAKAQMPVARAPQPGRRLTLDARWLQAMAQSAGIDWKPMSNYDRIVVERAGQTVDIGVIETELREALVMEGLPKDAQFEITNRTQLSMVIPTDQTPTIAIKDVIIDPRTQRFQAMVEAPAGSPQAQRVKVTGRTFVTTRIPTLARAMSRGETITERDIQWTDVREEALRQDCALDVRQVIGMEPRNLLKAGQPIRMAELQRPVLVGRNSLVTMILHTPFMTLTAQGKAGEDGGMGDVVKVTNLQTKQIVEARVQSAGTVVVNAVPPARPLASAY